MMGNHKKNEKPCSNEHTWWGKNGFTLAELLIVVAIIAVLVAIAIPIFKSQLEKSREATDLANVRVAYAEIMTAAMTEDSTATYNGVKIKNGEFYSAEVPLKQRPGWVMDKDKITIAECNYANGGMKNEPGSWCTVRYNPNVGEGENPLLIDWNGGAFRYNEMGKRDFLTWNGDGTDTTNNNAPKRMSTEKLIQLEPNTKYTVTFTLPEDYEEDYKVQMGTLLFKGSTPSDVKNDKWSAADGETYYADSKWLAKTEYVGTSSNKTVTYTFYTDSAHTYFGANFRVLKDGKDGVNLKTDDDAHKLAEEALKSLEVRKQPYARGDGSLSGFN